MTAGFISQILRIHDCYTTLNNIYRLCISITRYECHAIFYTKVQLYGGIIPIKTLHICYWAPDKPFFGTQSTFGRTAVPFSFVLFSKADVPYRAKIVAAAQRHLTQRRFIYGHSIYKWKDFVMRRYVECVSLKTPQKSDAA